MNSQEIEEIRNRWTDGRFIQTSGAIDDMQRMFAIVEELHKENEEEAVKRGWMFEALTKERDRFDIQNMDLQKENDRLRAERDTFKTIAEEATKESTWGCGHTNHGSCSQCLGHVTNERNDLLRKNEELQKDYSEECLRSDNLEDLYIHQAAEVRSLEERLKLAEKVVEYARRQEAVSDYTSNTLLEAVAQYDSARALGTPQAKDIVKNTDARDSNGNLRGRCPRCFEENKLESFYY